MMKFIKWVDEQPINPEQKQRLFIKINGKRDVIVFIIGHGETEGKWCWSMAWDDSRGKHISKEELSKIEWLNEDYKSKPTSLEGCPFNYCDSNPKCEGRCHYA